MSKSRNRIMIINTIGASGDEAIVLAAEGSARHELDESAHSGAIVLLSDLWEDIAGDVPDDAGIWVIDVDTASDPPVVTRSRRATGSEGIAVAQGRDPWDIESEEAQIILGFCREMDEALERARAEREPEQEDEES